MKTKQILKKFICAVSLISSTLLIQAQDQTKVDWEQVSYLLGELETMDVASVRAAFNEMKKSSGYDTEKYEPKMQELEALGNWVPNRLPAGNDWAIGRAKRAIELRREILLSNPLLDSDKIVAVRYHLGKAASYVMAPSLGTQQDNWTSQFSAYRDGYNAELVEISNLRVPDKKLNIRTIYKPQHDGGITNVVLNWDAERILFTATDPNNKWHVFEINRDGSNFHKVIKINEPDLEFFDAAYMPNGKIMAMTNIGYQGAACEDGSFETGNMIEYNPETGTMRRMTFDQDDNWHPRVMNNGRLMYTRWEYTDLTHYYSRFVMHANPDGTETKALYGSGGWFPNSLFDAEPLPGKNSAFVAIVSGHHGTARSGRLMLFDPAKGRKELEGIVQEIPFSKRPIEPLIKDQLVDGVWPQFTKPWPLDDKFFLVTAKLSLKSPWGIYLVDVFDNMTQIALLEEDGFINPIMVTKRPVPPIIPEKVKLDEKEATFFIQNIYHGEGLPGVPVGTVKKLRIFAYEYCYVRTSGNHAAQGIQSGWDIKRLLGEVDVELDGSVMFKAPANTPISIQPLDSEGRALQWMRSWTTGMPGELVSCVGCHENQNTIPIPKRVLASMKKAKSLEAPEGGTRSITYELEIQPILDRACISCHNRDNLLDFRGNIYEDNILTNHKSNRGQEIKTSTSYLNLHPYVNRQGPEADIYVMKPYEYHASTSELVKILKRGHHEVELTDKEWRAIYAWIDMNAPFHGKFVDNLLPGCPTNQYDRRIELANKYGNGAGVDWRKELADYSDYLKQKKAKMPQVTYAISHTPTYKEVKVKGWPFTVEEARDRINASNSKKKVEIAPGIVVSFVRIPAGKFVLGNNKHGQSNNAPESETEIGKPFWMAETELTNEQYNVIFPEHDSRYIAQFWKDHVQPGYPANRPKQPVIRVSWNEAMEYCGKLSKQTGFHITLPTEAQWEWACRTGSDNDMWYGSFDTDFANYDNMADSQLSNMAVSGVDPTPMPHHWNEFKWYNFIPKDSTVDDRNMIVIDVAKYQPNPWGLYDMHGNVAEFTRSSYAAYPYDSNAQNDLKVYRGGSWIDRAKNSTSYSRNEAYAWQPLNKVGFRLIIED